MRVLVPVIPRFRLPKVESFLPAMSSRSVLAQKSGLCGDGELIVIYRGLENLTDENTRQAEYTARLQRLQTKNWKKRLTSLNPYRMHIRRVAQGKVLDIGCGIGRCLGFIPDRAIGVDNNETSINVCLDLGYRAYTPDQFKLEFVPGESSFDTVLLSHVVEHMNIDQAKGLIEEYLPYCRAGCRLVLIAPQEKGFKSDATHVEFMDFSKLSQIGGALGFERVKQYSYPFPRLMGKAFIYNEFVHIGRRFRVY